MVPSRSAKKPVLTWKSIAMMLATLFMHIGCSQKPALPVPVQPNAQQVGEVVAAFVSRAGSAKVRRMGDPEGVVVKAGMMAYSGDVILTNELSRITLLSSNGNRLQVNERTILQMRKYQDGTEQIELQAGDIVLKVDPKVIVPPLQVKLDQVLVSAAKAELQIISRDEKATVVRVREGEARIQGVKKGVMLDSKHEAVVDRTTGKVVKKVKP